MVDSWIAVTIGAVLFTLLPGFFNFYSGEVLRLPAILLIYFVVLLELALYGIVRIQIKVLEALFGNAKNRELRKAQRKATNYQEWYQIGQQLDLSQKHRRSWATNLNDWTAKHFSWSYLAQMMADMKLAREENDVMMGIAVVQQCIRKNVGGIFSEDLYSHLYTGEPKQLVTEFVQEIVTTLKWVTHESKAAQKQDAVRQLLERALTAYGRTSLCLSGGGMMACYHLGIIKAFHDESMLPKIISGASAGSLIAAFTCVRTDEELERDLCPEVLEPKFICCNRSWPHRVRSYFQTGYMFDNEEWLDLVKWFTCGDMTFDEAYQKTGRTLCITLSTTSKMSPPILLNHLTAPNVVIASAVVASACVPGLLKPMYLQSKTADGTIELLKEEYWDGSIEQDIPMGGLAEQLNCQFFVVVQCNPHQVPFYFNSDGIPGQPNRWTHSRRGGYLYSGIELYLKLDMLKNLNFLKEVGAVTGVTSKLMTQSFAGTATIVPRVTFQDYFKIVEDPDLDDMKRYFHGGSVAAYGSVAMIRLHYEIARTIDECRKSLQMPEVSSYDQVIEKLTRKSTMTDNIISQGRQSLDSKQTDDDDDVWVPIMYSSRGSILQGAIARK